MYYYKTGIEGLDILLNKGIPDKTTIIFYGNTGTGIKVFTQQFLFSGLMQNDLTYGIYFTAERPAAEIANDMNFYNWKIDQFVKQKKLFFIDAYTARHEKKFSGELSRYQGMDWDMGAANQLRMVLLKKMTELNDMRGEFERKGKHLEIRGVIDSLSALLMNHSLDEVIDLFEAIQINVRRYGGIYIFLLVEGMHDPETVATLSHMADGIFDFSTKERGPELENVIRIKKLRNMIYSTKLIPYAITRDGIVIENVERII
ncbi:MAG: RAD55 family ATPase [Candidatus Methanofastidiosia archaeon]